jgi:hypothetical protein
MRKGLILAAVGLFSLAACMDNTAQQDDSPPTATLVSIVSMTPRFTSTAISTRTPLPTFTLTPSETPIPPTPSDTPTPTDIPPVIGIVASINTVNVREGPGVSFVAFTALTPGTRIEVLGQNAEGNWLNIELEDGREGWIAFSLVRLQETPTPLPTLTPSPDLTALALGTPLPTAILGGGTVTPTPPFSALSPTPVTPTDEAEAQTGPTLTPFLPIINVESINQTATALVSGGVVAATVTPRASVSATEDPLGPTPTLNILASATALSVTAQSGVAGEGEASAQQGADVLAYCNERSFGRPAPSNLAAGSTIDVFWSWFAQTEAQIQDHLANVSYEVALDGVTLNYRDYRGPIRQQNDGNYWVYWYVPAGPLSAGPHEITYRVLWREQITDGYDVFGPGTNNPEQRGTCSFTVTP